MATDPWDDPRARRWKHDMERKLYPMIADSQNVISLCPSNGEPDAKFSVELGFAIMLGKPIVLVIEPEQVIPGKLARVADHVIRADMSTDTGRQVVADELAVWLRDAT